MAVAEGHPSAEELAAFTLGTLDDDTDASIGDHVDSCKSCQERAATAPDDTFVELLRDVYAVTGSETDTDAGFAAQVLTPLSLLAKPDRVEVPEALPAELAHHERYLVVRFVGAGGMGAVYEAEHRVLRRPVALKVIKRAYTANAAALERFRREVRTAARLSHPNIVTTYDAEDAGETHFLVMEYIEGTDLGRLVQESGPIPVDRACDYVRQAALGLQYAFEQGMVHRDLKPQNLMLTDGGCVKILDFGLARFAGEAALAGVTTSGMVLGTVDYIAPEQADDAHEADIRSDIYSLGCTLYYLLAGQPPFPRGTPPQKLMAHVNKTPQPLTQLRGDIPEGLMSVLERMMAKNPRRRYQTPAEVAAALAAFTVPADSTPSPGLRSDARATVRGRTLLLQKTPTRFRRRRIVEIATAIMAFFVAGLLGAAVYRIATDKGELVITTESDDVKVVITQGGKLVDVIDTKTDKQIKLALRSGEYELELKGAPEGLKLTVEKATLTRGKETLAKIERWKTPPAEKVGEVRRFLGHDGRVYAVAFSPDGRLALSAGEADAGKDSPIRLWDVETGKILRRLEGHRGIVYDAAFSPDGKRVLSCGDDNTVRLWDAETGKELKRLEGHTATVWSAVFSPDGKRALSGGQDKTVRLWDLESAKQLLLLEGHKSNVRRLAFSPDGRRALSGGAERPDPDPRICLWDLETGALLKTLEGHAGYVCGVAFLPDGQRAVSCGADGTIRLWDLGSGKRSKEIKGGPKEVLHALALSPDGRRLLTGGYDQTVRLWDLEAARELACFFWHTGAVSEVAFSPDGRYALSGGVDGTMRLWRLPDPPPVKKRP
jgi:WD40 repeat protein